MHLICRVPKDVQIHIYEFDDFKYKTFNKCNLQIKNLIKKRQEVMLNFIHTRIPVNFDKKEFYEWTLAQTVMKLYFGMYIINKYKFISD